MKLRRSTASPNQRNETSPSGTDAAADTVVGADAGTATRTAVDETVTTSPVRPTDGIWDVISLAGLPTSVIRSDGSIAWCNPVFAEIVGLEPGDTINRQLAEVLGCGPLDGLDKAVRRAVRGEGAIHRLEIDAVSANGDRRRVALSGAHTSAWPQAGHLVVAAEDITPDRRMTHGRVGRAIDALANERQDALTGLPNRDQLEILLNTSMRRSARQMTNFAVYVCNIDDFKAVNETYGHAVGDEILKWIGTRLTRTLRHHDSLARTSGDEFVVIAEEVPDDQTAKLVARRLLSAIDETIIVDEHEIRVTMSIGSTMCAGHGRPADLLAEADRAMRAAKRAGKAQSMSLSDIIAATTPVSPFSADASVGEIVSTGIAPDALADLPTFDATQPVTAHEMTTPPPYTPPVATDSVSADAALHLQLDEA